MNWLSLDEVFYRVQKLSTFTVHGDHYDGLFTDGEIISVREMVKDFIDAMDIERAQYARWCAMGQDADPSQSRKEFEAKMAKHQTDLESLLEGSRKKDTPRCLVAQHFIGYGFCGIDSPKRTIIQPHYWSFLDLDYNQLLPAKAGSMLSP